MGLPESGTIDAQRKRLINRMSQLGDLYSWGIPEGEYRSKRAETRRLIAELPDDDKVGLFDRPRKVVESMADNVDKATPEQKADLVRLLVRRVEARDRVNVMDSIMWSPHVRPFFEHVDDVAECPRTDSRARDPRRRTHSIGMQPGDWRHPSEFMKRMPQGPGTGLPSAFVRQAFARRTVSRPDHGLARYGRNPRTVHGCPRVP